MDIVTNIGIWNLVMFVRTLKGICDAFLKYKEIRDT